MISLYDFFDRPYWRRLWIIQELAMAHHSAPILCGDYVTQWRYVRDGALLLCMMADTVRDAMQRALARRGRKTTREPSFEHAAAIAELAFSGNRRDVVQTNEPLLLLQPGVLDVEKHRGMTMTNVRMPPMKTLDGTPVHQALTLVADAICGWDRDRVLGLLAIPALKARLPLRNDSHFAGLPAKDIYVQFAKACIQADHSLDIFSFLEGGWHGPDDDVRQNLPSWCPRFHIKNKIGRIEGDCWHAQPRFPKYNPNDLESIEFESVMGPEFEGDSMVIQGWVIDSVDALGGLSASDMPNVMPESLFKAGYVPPRFHPDWSGIKEARHPYWSSEPDVYSIPDQIWMSLIGGTGTHGKKAPPSFKCLLDSFPESWPPNDGFLYRRNYDFLEANRDLPIAGKPLSSYFKRQPVSNFSDDAISSGTGEHTYYQSRRSPPRHGGSHQVPAVDDDIEPTSHGTRAGGDAARGLSDYPVVSQPAADRLVLHPRWRRRGQRGARVSVEGRGVHPGFDGWGVGRFGGVRGDADD